MKINLLFVLPCLSLSFSNNLSAQKIYSSLYEIWNNNGWEKKMLQSYGYDANLVNTSYLKSDWSGNSWVPDRKITYNVNAAGNQTSSATQQFQPSTSTWSNVSKSVRTYTSSYLLNEIVQSWNGTNYVNSANTTYSYSNTYRMLSVRSESWTGNIWQNSGIQSYSYTSGGTMTLILYQYWAPSVSTWSNSLVSTNTYSLGLLTQQVSQTWTNTGWQNWIRYRVSYDANSMRDSMYLYTWASSQWQASQLYTYSADATGNTTLTTEYAWDFANQDWDPIGRWTYVYDETKKTALEENETQLSEFNIYPVPAENRLSIRIEGAVEETPFTILDSNGNIVMRGTITDQHTELDISKLPAGVYLISNGPFAPKKFIKE